ncbi:unnamed protein product [Camellia sinensis]
MTDPTMELLQESGWEELRKEARKIEGDLDVKLSSYAKLGSRFSHGVLQNDATLLGLDRSWGDNYPKNSPLLGPNSFISTSYNMAQPNLVINNDMNLKTVLNDGYVDSGSPTTVGSSRSWKSMEMEIQSLLEKLLDINDAMSRCAASATPTTSVTQKLARHRDILHEFTQEFKRTKGNINSMREHAELLSSVREDISEYKASGSMSPRVQLLRERASIHGSISHGEILGNDLQEEIDDVISQAQSTRAALGSQRAFFGNVEGKVKLLSDKFPIIRGLLGSIRRKKSRDTLILSAVIAACTLFLIIYWLSK